MSTITLIDHEESAEAVSSNSPRIASFVLMPDPSPDRVVVGTASVSFEEPVILAVGFSGGQGVEVLYGEEASRPDKPLNPGITRFRYNPPNQFHLQYTIQPGGSRFKLAPWFER